MFTIIGGDGREYGPVTADQVRAWITAGRANLETKARTVGSEDWRRLGDFSEFAPPSEVPPLPPESPYASAPELREIELPLWDDLPLGSIGARTGAAFLNGFLYFLGMMPGSVYAGLRLIKEHPELARGKILSPEDVQGLMGSMAASFVWMYVGLFFVIAVQAVFIAVNGQNIGKLIAGVRVVSLDGSKAGFIRGALIRFIVPVSLIFLLNVIPMLGFLFLVVDYCFMFREDRRCLHDLMAGTKVVKA